MEKLVLRGIMHGADKIPDKWFEKVPGGYYKPKDDDIDSKTGSHSSGSRRSRRDDRTHAGGKPHGEKNHRRRHSDGNDNPQRNEKLDYNRDEEEAFYNPSSDRQQPRRGKPDRTSVDGGDDDDDHRAPGREDMSRRHHEDPGRHHRRRYSNDDYDDDDRYGYDDGYRRGGRSSGHPPTREYASDGRRRTHGQDPYDHDDAGSLYVPPMNPGVSAAGVAAGVAGAAAASGAYHNGYYDPAGPTSRASMNGTGSGVANAYVPYAHIYGQPASNAPPKAYSPAPPSNMGSVQPNGMNQLATPAPTNPFGPEASIAGSVPPPPMNGSHYSARYNGHGPDPRYDTDSRYNDQYYDEDQRYYGYDSEGRPYHASPPPQDRHRRRDSRSHSRDSYSDTTDPSRRARSERRPSRKDGGSSSTRPQDGRRGKSLSRLKERFDTSQQGLGYGAVGAVAGGLVGSELGKGPLAAAIVAALGGIGANAFAARERFVDPRIPTATRRPDTQPNTEPMVLRQAHGRKEDVRNNEWSKDPTIISRREEKERARAEAQRERGGYYSD